MKKAILILIISSVFFASCTTRVLSVDDYPSSPCHLRRLIELESSDSLKAANMQEYIGLRKLCEDHRNTIQVQNEIRRIGDIQSTAFYTGLIITTIAVIMALNNSK